MLPTRSTLQRAAGTAGVIAALAALPTANAAARPVRPSAHAAVAPLLVPVATFILRELAVGVLNKVGGEAFGAAMAEAGFGNPDSARLKAVDEKLARIEVTMNELNNKVDGIAASLAFARLSAVRTSVRDLVGRIEDARERLQQLTDGSITDPTLRQEKRNELLEIIRTKLLTEQNSLNEAIFSPQGNDDIVRMAFLAERSGGRRFFNDTRWRQAASIVTFYRDEAAELLLLRVEYEYSSVKQDSTPEYIAQRKAIVQGMVDKQNEAYGRINSGYPSVFGLPDNLMVVDTKPDASGRHLVWLNDSRFMGSLVGWGSIAFQYNDALPSLGQFRHLVSGRGGMTPPQYLHSEGFTVPILCAGKESIEWTNDGSGSSRWVWGAHDDGQGQLGIGCQHIRVRHLREGERYW